MRVFRLSRRKYPLELSGKGAAASGNRWNSKGTEMVYCAESRALAVAEVVVHLSLATLPKDFVMLEVNIPEAVSSRIIKAASLPTGWNLFPHLMPTQQLGDEFIQTGKHCVLKVPSAVVTGDHNILLNPHHGDFKKIKIVSQTDFPLDERLLG